MKYSIPVIAVLLSSCYINDGDFEIIPSEQITFVESTLPEFSGIDISTAFIVDYELSPEYSIEVEVNENLLEYTYGEVVDSILFISLYDNLEVIGNPTLHATVRGPNLNFIDISEASAFSSTTLLASEHSNIYASGASIINLNIQSDEIRLYVSGASQATFNGLIGTLNATVSGASTVGNFETRINTLNIDLSGASSATYTVNNEIYVTASGASYLGYAGSGEIISESLSGFSSVQKMD